MPRPGEDRSDVGGAAQFNNIGPVPLPLSPVPLPVPDVGGAAQFNNIGPVPLSASQYRTCPAFRFPISDLSRFPLPVPLSASYRRSLGRWRGRPV